MTCTPSVSSEHLVRGPRCIVGWPCRSQVQQLLLHEQAQAEDWRDQGLPFGLRRGDHCASVQHVCVSCMPTPCHTWTLDVMQHTASTKASHIM